MRKFLFIFLFLFCIVLPANADNNKYKVIKVIDGDTVYIDFNKNGIAEKDEKVRINGIDTFETRVYNNLARQIKRYNLTTKEALGLGYYGKEFAKKKLLNKYVIAEYSAGVKTDSKDRKLMSVYYNCIFGYCKSYDKEILKSGYAVVFPYSNKASELKLYENPKKLKENVIKTHKLELVLLNKNTKKYHKLDCETNLELTNSELIQRPKHGNYKPAQCCYIKPVENDTDK